jgi:hypothetical protein
MKMYCKIKRPDNAKESISKGEKVVIQEKIDGSNTAILNDNGKIRYFSRSQELTGEDGLGGFIKYIKAKEDKILQYLPNGYVLYGEWLGQGKINYNSLAKQGKIEPYYAFDLVKEIINKSTEDEDFTRVFASIDEMKNIANEIGLKIVPELDVIDFDNYDDLKVKYVDNQKSALEGTDSIREGIVIKTIDGAKRIKIVADTFQEVKTIKNSQTKSPYAFLDKYITPMRICKFLTTIGIENPTKEDYIKIFKQLDVIAKDILEEEGEQILKDLGRIIKQQAISNIKEYVEQTKEE